MSVIELAASLFVVFLLATIALIALLVTDLNRRLTSLENKVENFGEEELSEPIVDGSRTGTE